MEPKILKINNIPFVPITIAESVIVKNKNGRETTLDKVLIKDSDMSLKIEDGVISHTNQIASRDLGLYEIAYDELGHITDSTEILLSDDLHLDDENKLKITYQIL